MTSDSGLPVVAAAAGIGYVLLVAWFIAIGVQLLNVSAGIGRSGLR